jgi:thymidylate kinase
VWSGARPRSFPFPAHCESAITYGANLVMSAELIVSDEPSIALVRDLCAALDAAGVDYCHWKSNAFLDRSRSGENDLDLLIRRADSDRFSSTLHRLDFKAATNPSRGLPGVTDYYGYDEDADRLVHVHAHYQLVVGDDLTKNYRIPLENAFLDLAIRERDFRVPPPELELILLVIRLVLKHRTWDAVLARRGGVSAGARAELDFLTARVDEERLLRLLDRHLPFVDPQTLTDCRRALAAGGGRWIGIRAGRRLVADLRPCERRSRAADVRLKLWRRGLGLFRRVASRPEPRKQLRSGGALIAIVGADGAGKSTLVEGLATWLEKTFAVTRIHLGRPPKSRSTVLVTALVRAAALPTVRSRRAAARAGLPRGPRASLAVALARDRFLTARNARRIATNGGLVVSDRFPLPELTLMDAPRIQPGSAGAAGRLAALERKYYRAMPKPDLVVVLRVDPEVAVERKPDEPADFVRARWREIWEIDWDGVAAHVVDAGRPPEDVLRRVKSLLWSEL